MLQTLLDHFLEFLRSKFKSPTGRSLTKLNGYVIKIYNDHSNTSRYEHDVLSEIARSNTIAFKVPRAFKLIKAQSGDMLIVERVIGHNLDGYLWKFWLCNDVKAVRSFYQLGKAMRELHSLDLSGLRTSNLPSSSFELKRRIIELAKGLVALRVVDKEVFRAISSALEKLDVANEIFSRATLHGELYFTHVLVQDGRIVLLDFHNAQKGPSYFDLAMLSVSLYVSLAFPFLALKRLASLIGTFLKGYYGKDLNTKVIRSLKLAELYVALEEILAYVNALHIKSSLTNLLTMLKIKRLRVAVKRIILPTLTTHQGH